MDRAKRECAGGILQLRESVRQQEWEFLYLRKYRLMVTDTLQRYAIYRQSVYRTSFTERPWVTSNYADLYPFPPRSYTTWSKIILTLG